MVQKKVRKSGDEGVEAPRYEGVDAHGVALEITVQGLLEIKDTHRPRALR
jgi:hypothetical protein